MFKIIYGWQCGWQSKTQKIFWHCSCRSNTWKRRRWCFAKVMKFLVFPQKRFTEWACVQETSTVFCAVSADRAIATRNTLITTLVLSGSATGAGSTTVTILVLTGSATGADPVSGSRGGRRLILARCTHGISSTGSTTVTTLVLAGSAIGTDTVSGSRGACRLILAGCTHGVSGTGSTGV